MPVSREVGAPSSLPIARHCEGKTIAMMQRPATDAFAANMAVSLVTNRYGPVSHGDCYRVGTRGHSNLSGRYKYSART